MIKLLLFFFDEIPPSIKANDRINFALDVEINHAIEKIKLQYKLTYKAFKEEY